MQSLLSLASVALFTFAPGSCFFAQQSSSSPTPVGAGQPAPVPPAPKAESDAASATSQQMAKLAKMIAGTWIISATSEPTASRPHGAKDTGRSIIKFGPAKLSLVEDYRTDGDHGHEVALGTFWWDSHAQGYKTMFCDSTDPDGCSVYDGIGKWDGDDLVFWFQFPAETGSRPEFIKEVLHSTSPSSFTAAFFRGENSSELHRYMTVAHNRPNASPSHKSPKLPH
jgi:hypothetical protein